MSGVVCSDPSYVPRKPRSIHRRGQIVVITANRGTQGLPTGKKLWIREIKYDSSHEKSRSELEDEKSWWYLLKDGPGEDAKDVGWASEESLDDWSEPKKEESLIDLDPGYPDKEEEPLIDFD